MKSSLKGWTVIAALSATPLFAEISGTVTNGTSGKPQAGVTVTLVHPGENGMESVATVKSGADGSFSIDKPLPPPPALLQAEYQGVQYNLFLQPGAPAIGLKLNVFEPTSQASSSITEQHLLVLEPQPDGLHVEETFLVQNNGTTTLLDPVHLYLPKEAAAGAKVTVEVERSMPVTRTPEKTSQADVYKVGYPAKPGQTVYEITYALPPASKFSGRVLGQGSTLLVTPSTVTLTGDALKDDGIKSLGQGGTEAHVYEVQAKAGAAYEIGIEGTGVINTQAGNGGGEAQPSEEEGGPPKEKAGNPRLYQRLPLVLGLAFGILALGGTLLYRRGGPEPGPSA